MCVIYQWYRLKPDVPLAEIKEVTDVITESSEIVSDHNMVSVGMIASVMFGQ